MFEFLISDSCICYCNHNLNKSLYIALDKDYHFIAEQHNDITFFFAYGQYYVLDSSIVFNVDSVKSLEYVKEYGDSVIWNYFFNPSIIYDYKYIICNKDSLLQMPVNTSCLKLYLEKCNSCVAN